MTPPLQAGYRQIQAVFLALVLGLALVGLMPAAASAARLVGGRQETAIRKAFTKDPNHHGRVIVSIRVSGVSSSWAVVKSAKAPASGHAQEAHVKIITLQSDYYHDVHGKQKAAKPPKKVKDDLDKDFRVRLKYSASGSESFHYSTTAPSTCGGGGNYMDVEEGSVSPMSWDMRYVIDLDKLVSIVSSPQGDIVDPLITLDFHNSGINVLETTARDSSDTGCSGGGDHFRCTQTYRTPKAVLAGVVAFLPGIGTEIGVPAKTIPSGDCDGSKFAFSPSYWDSGGAAAVVGGIDILGGQLPANPYAPISVSFPRNSFLQVEHSLSGPCGQTAGCTSSFHWSGQVKLAPYP